jgi:8-oxo-dGTP pyrophosphatase MutT (NUDIX family)
VHSFSVVPAVYVFLLRRSRAGRDVLLSLRQGTGYMDGHWAAAVAGHVEKGETVVEAAQREAFEEAGIRDLVLEPWCTMQRTGGTGLPVDERVDYFFTCSAWSGKPSLAEPEKAAAQRWFPLSDLPTPVVPHEAQVLASVLARSTPAIVSFGFD